MFDVLRYFLTTIFGTIRAKDKKTTSEALGFRVSGMQVSYILFITLIEPATLVFGTEAFTFHQEMHCCCIVTDVGLLEEDKTYPRIAETATQNLSSL